jgi:long-chain acyl-CoA synthetase
MPNVPARDVDWKELSAQHEGAQVPCAWLESSEPSYILYTSGTTGPPKGAMLAHRNLIITVDKLRTHFKLDRHNYEVVCYLPLCHVAERAISTVLHLETGGVVNYAESIDTVSVNLREIAPKVFLGVPRLW